MSVHISDSTGFVANDADDEDDVLHVQSSDDEPEQFQGVNTEGIEMDDEEIHPDILHNKRAPDVLNPWEMI